MTIDIKEKEKPKEKKDDKKDTEKESSSTNKDSTYGPDQAKEDDKKHSQSEGYPNDQLIQKTDRNLLERIIFFLMDGI